MSLDKLSQVSAIDTAKVAEGVEVTYIVGDAKFRTKITRGGSANKALQKLVTELIRPYARSGTDLSDIDPDIQKEIRAEALSKCVIVGWNDEDFGLPFNQENVQGVLLRNHKYAEFIDAECQRDQHFRAKQMEHNAGN